MSIDTKIEELKRQKERVKMFEKVIGFCEKLNSKTDPEGAELVSGVVKGFAQARISEIEDLVEVSAAIKAFSTKEVTVLKELVKKVDQKSSRKPQTVATSEQVSTASIPESATLNNPIKYSDDPVKFLMANKHLEHKNLIFSSNGNEITGKLVGMVTPNVVLELENKKRITVNYKNVLKEA